jgi:hypothetical protein
MIRVTVTRSSIVTNQADFSTQEEAQTWADYHIGIGSFGGDYEISYQEITPSLINDNPLEYLSSTDWKIIRHYDQLLAGVIPTLSQDELLLLLAQRQSARDAI